MYSALDIAKWFLNYNLFLRNVDNEDTDDISNLKLQKLLYYAQGCYLAMYDAPLFKEDIVAWAHGPVVREVYDEYKAYGSGGITPPDDYPESMAPSLSDLNVVVERRYKYGFVVCHNGTIYKYRVNKVVDKVNYIVAINKFFRNGFNLETK